MSDDLARLLADHGIQVPALEPVAAPEGVRVLGFTSAGEEAVAWWRRLCAVGDRIGYRPVLLEQGGAVTGGPAVEGTPAERLARAAELDAVTALNPGGVTLESLEPWQRDDMLERWSEDPRRIDAFVLPFSAAGEPVSVLVALVAAEHGWQIPALFGYGNWNECPPPEVHGAVLRHWSDRYGAELVCLTESSVELAVSRPPRTEADALAFAWEYGSYCADGVDAIYEADDVAGLAASLIDAEIVIAWWD